MPKKRIENRVSLHLELEQSDMTWLKNYSDSLGIYPTAVLRAFVKGLRQAKENEVEEREKVV